MRSCKVCNWEELLPWNHSASENNSRRNMQYRICKVQPVNTQWGEVFIILQPLTMMTKWTESIGLFFSSKSLLVYSGIFQNWIGSYSLLLLEEKPHIHLMLCNYLKIIMVQCGCNVKQESVIISHWAKKIYVRLWCLKGERKLWLGWDELVTAVAKIHSKGLLTAYQH